jgi:mannose-6-phosphate isomerase-like protein (cupin superfamily)
MTLNIRRVITDHDAEGRAVVAIDERCTNLISRRPGHQSCVAWTGDDGTICRIVEYRPGVAPRKHRTETIDYAVVLSGEIDMQLDDSVVHLRAGDVLVQQATLHDWVNRGAVPCVIAFVLVPAKPVERDGKVLRAVG